MLKPVSGILLLRCYFCQRQQQPGQEGSHEGNFKCFYSQSLRLKNISSGLAQLKINSMEVFHDLQLKSSNKSYQIMFYPMLLYPTDPRSTNSLFLVTFLSSVRVTMFQVRHFNLKFFSQRLETIEEEDANGRGGAARYLVNLMQLSDHCTLHLLLAV